MQFTNQKYSQVCAVYNIYKMIHKTQNYCMIAKSLYKMKNIKYFVQNLWENCNLCCDYDATDNNIQIAHVQFTKRKQSRIKNVFGAYSLSKKWLKLKKILSIKNHSPNSFTSQKILDHNSLADFSCKTVWAKKLFKKKFSLKF